MDSKGQATAKAKAPLGPVPDKGPRTDAEIKKSLRESGVGDGKTAQEKADRLFDQRNQILTDDEPATTALQQVVVELRQMNKALLMISGEMLRAGRRQEQ